MSNEFAKQFREDKKEAMRGTAESYKFKDGENRIRILGTPKKFFKAYVPVQGVGFLYLWHDCGIQGTMKYLAHAWVYQTDREGNDTSFIAIIELSMKTMQAIVDLMLSEEHKFDSFPMPYDIDINVSNAGSISAIYSVNPVGENSPVPDQAMIELSEQKSSIEEILEKRKEESKQKWEQKGKAYMNGGELPTVEYPTDDINPTDIPF